MTSSHQHPENGSGHHPDPEALAHVHAHAHGPAEPVSKHLRKVIAAVLIPFATAVLVGLAVLWPGGAPAHERTGVGFDRQTETGEVVRVERIDCKDVNAAQVPPTGDTSTPQGREAINAQQGQCKRATIEVTSGQDKGRQFVEIVQPDAPRQLEQGQGVVVAYAPDAPEDLQYSVTDVDRKFPLLLLSAVFALAVVAVGRLRGVMALIALGTSFVFLTFFVLPAILQGSNPLVVAVVGSSAIMLIALYLSHGLSARTSVAVLGTLISLLIIGLLGSLFIGWARLTGNTDDYTGLIHGLYPNIDMSGLLLAGVIIGSLGVLDDVTVTQTSAVWELHRADPAMGPRALYRAGIRIGRDHIASVVNTLVLAYAGAALPLLLLFSIAQSSVGTVANSELVAQEIVRTLVGSIGLVASVPVTTGLAALVVSADRPSGASSPVRTGRGRRRKK
ncbi:MULTISPECIES: YibE/F family protein [Streptomyces]|uniref:YibE/F family protein n=1 Tax=Streptomyces sudanensis TaxID=436397 RepID=A0ABY4TGJ1_9ACTN|nr:MULTISPECIES: YibE/F family protein [Streptomyces]MCP9958182.1 YibE/F family protein [Streptomyces sudanensis]MCP9987305.1 YibE/F family protein [Streptomyces sudanensis]MCQ0001298.1 YibE/F family protein [Streptomyces sudanensis]URN16898.1 YibE/F family protein [Streptomyces sudanensis]